MYYYVCGKQVRKAYSGLLSSYISEQDGHATLELCLADTIISGLLTASISVPSIRGNSVADCTGPTFVIYFMSLSVETTIIGKQIKVLISYEM